MGNINKIKLPDGNTYNIIDTTSGYGKITGVSLNGTPVATSGVANIEIAAAAISVNASVHTLNITTNVTNGDEVEY